jgi:uncharacterized RDD family membrane protein YckC
VERNPYAAPTAAVRDSGSPPTEDELASHVQRFLNMLIDVAGYFVLAMLIGVLLGLFAPGAIESLELSGPLAEYLFGVLIFTIYYLPLEAAFGRTLGKLVTRTRVVTVDGGTPNFHQLLGRTMARFVPFEAFSFLSRDAVGWHDRWSGTRVVRVRRD